MLGQQLLMQVLVSAVVVFLFVTSILGLILGLGLMLRSGSTMPFIVLMNRWVSTRQVVRPLELPRQLTTAGNPRWFGVILIAVGAYAAVVLVGSFDVPRLALLFHADARYSVTGLALESLKWLLVVGALAAVATGVMLLFFPNAWRRVEERANRWYSTRELEIAGDTVYLSLDRVVEAYPRAAGGAIFLLSVVAAMASGLMLLR